MVVYIYFLGCLLGRQKLDQTPGGASPTDDKCVVPIFTVFQFLFYMGWLKVYCYHIIFIVLFELAQGLFLQYSSSCFL